MKERKLNFLEPSSSASASLQQLPSMAQSHSHHHHPPPRTEVEHQQYPQAQPLTIFYNGQVSICTVDEFQARAILLVARREMEEAGATVVSPSQPPPSSSSSRRPAQAQSQLGRPLSMKRSLQQFLHKRNHRINPPNPPHQ